MVSEDRAGEVDIQRACDGMTVIGGGSVESWLFRHNSGMDEGRWVRSGMEKDGRNQQETCEFAGGSGFRCGTAKWELEKWRAGVQVAGGHFSHFRGGWSVAPRQAQVTSGGGCPDDAAMFPETLWKLRESRGNAGMEILP